MTLTLKRGKRGLQIGGRLEINLRYPHEVSYQLMFKRMKLGLPIPKLAKLAGVSPSTIYNYEAGRTFMPSMKTIVKLCRPLNMRLILENLG